ncbi:MAG: response regulator transcription factor [Eubacteriaceae bacterium]|jgi:DNA-binding response OmpR family regulator|nr:response regulator transcription factor [Eubacteriaceae bacterium]
MNEKILVVDDEVNICELLKLELKLEGYECETALDGFSALESFEEFAPDLVILDIMLPNMSGIEVCEKMTSQRNVPVIMLTAKTDVGDKILGLKTGADDYMTKPFDTGELLARVEALLRRYSTIIKRQRERQTLRNGPLLLVPESQSAYIGSALLHLTATEYDILKMFVSSRNKAFSREMIARSLGLDFQIDTRAIDMHIQRLRKKIAELTDDRYIETVFGIGYRMKDLESPAP